VISMENISPQQIPPEIEVLLFCWVYFSLGLANYFGDAALLSLSIGLHQVRIVLFSCCIC